MTTKTVEVADIIFEELTQLTGSEPVIVTHGGDPIFAVVPLDEFDYETWVLSENTDFIALIERSRERYKQEGGIPLEEVRRRLGLDNREP